MPHESRQQPAGGVVDHRNQIHLLPTALQPVVVAGVPLHQLAPAAPPRPPVVHLPHPAPASSPRSCLRHPSPQRLFAPRNLVPLTHLLGRQRSPQTPVHRVTH